VSLSKEWPERYSRLSSLTRRCRCNDARRPVPVMTHGRNGWPAVRGAHPGRWGAGPILGCAGLNRPELFLLSVPPPGAGSRPNVCIRSRAGWGRGNCGWAGAARIGGMPRELLARGLAAGLQCQPVGGGQPQGPSPRWGPRFRPTGLGAAAPPPVRLGTRIGAQPAGGRRHRTRNVRPRDC
jgi:hypothetical protein